MSKLPRPKGFEDPNFMPSQSILKALGRVSVVSASIEEELHAIYWKMLNATDSVGKVITGDMRANRMAEDILKIAKAAKMVQAKIEDLEDLFKDFKEKNQKRNQCLHWIWESSREVKAPAYKPSQVIPSPPNKSTNLPTT
jgi:hypothetical protein